MERKYIIWYLAFILMVSYSNLLAQAPETLWTRMWGNGWLLPDDRFTIRYTLDAGFITAGTYGNEAIVMKFSEGGDSLWGFRVYALDQARFNSVAQNNNSIYAAAGSYDTWFEFPHPYAKLFDNSGHGIGGAYFDSSSGGFSWVDEGQDNGFVLIDDEAQPGRQDFDIRLSKIDNLGNVQWQQYYGGPENNAGLCVESDVHGGYVVAGAIYGGPGNSNAYLVRSNATGDTIWTRYYGGDRDDMFAQVVSVPDGGYAAVGTSHSFGPDSSNIYVVRTDSLGDILWFRLFGWDTFNTGKSIDRVPSGGFIVGGDATNGYLSNRGHLIRLNDAGDTLWTKALDNNDISWIHSVIALPDSGFAFTGGLCTDSVELYSYLWLVRLRPEALGVDERAPSLPNGFSLSQNYPNPFNSQTTISFDILDKAEHVNLKVYNIAGQLVSVPFKGQAKAGHNQFIWNGTDEDGKQVSSGIYFYSLETDKGSISRRMVLIK